MGKEVKWAVVLFYNDTETQFDSKTFKDNFSSVDDAEQFRSKLLEDVNLDPQNLQVIQYNDYT